MRSHQVEIKEVNQTPRGDAWVVDNRHAGWDERFSSLEDAEDYRRQGFEEFAAAEISENGVTITQDPQTLKWSVVDGTGTQYLAGQFDTKLAASRKMQSDLMADFTSNNPIVQLQEASDATSHSNWVEPGAVPLTYTEKLFTLQKRKTADFRFGSFVNKNHFTQPDIIAHVRHNDRIGPDGEKILFLEEVQSDWHQAGSDTGYGERLPQKEVEELEGLEYVDGLQVDKANMERLIKGLPAGPEKDKVTLTYQGFMRDDYQPMTRDMKIRRRVLREKEFAARKGAGNAPFKRSWRSLAMKRMLKVAADEGYDAIAWTTGDAQNARYSLGSKITGLEVIDTGGNTYEIAARMPGEDVFRTVEIGVTKEKLPEYIGKETTKRALEGMEEGIAILEEGDLRLGGRFLRSVYDEKLPQLKIWKQTKDGNGNRLKPVRKMISDDLEANYVALNDSVKKKISSQGMPRYSPEVKLNKTRDLNKRGGAIYTNERGDRVVQTSLRAGIRIYSKQGKRIGPVFKSIEKAERHLAKMGK